jgi:hypothetical protein
MLTATFTLLYQCPLGQMPCVIKLMTIRLSVHGRNVIRFNVISLSAVRFSAHRQVS